MVDRSYGGLGDQPCAHLLALPSFGQPLHELCRVVDEIVPEHAKPLMRQEDSLMVVVREVDAPAGDTETQPRNIE
jgi:hypothetical protein